MTFNTQIPNAIILVEKLLKDAEWSHGSGHARKVMTMCIDGLRYFPDITPRAQRCVILAGLLHDVDDWKLYPKHKNFENAYSILRQCDTHPHDIATIVMMISLVSYSKNGDSTIPGMPRWVYLPRDMDRLEGFSVIRSLRYTLAQGVPLSVPSDPRLKTLQEITEYHAKNPNLAADYVSRGSGNSISMMKHYNEKLIHITVVNADIPPVASIKARALRPLHDIMMMHGEHGYLTEDMVVGYLKDNGLYAE